MDPLDLERQAKKQNILDMSIAFTAMMPLLQERSAVPIKQKLAQLFDNLDSLRSDQDFHKMHSDFCQWFVGTIRLVKTGESPSWGHAAKVLDLALKVYVYYCKMPSPTKAEALIPRLNGIIDTPILRYLFRKLESVYAKPFPPHYLWTIRMIAKEDYDLLQKVIRQHIRDRFGDEILPVQYDDVMKRSLEA